jgi:hypothetical protein
MWQFFSKPAINSLPNLLKLESTLKEKKPLTMNILIKVGVNTEGEETSNNEYSDGEDTSSNEYSDEDE